MAGPVRASVVAIVIVVLILAGGLAALHIGANGYYVLSPGDAPVVSASSDCRPSGGGSFSLPGGRPCVQLVLPADKVHPVQGSIMMVDVQEGKANSWQYLLHSISPSLLKAWDNGSVFYPVAAITGATPESQLSCQDTEQMNDATTFAGVAALSRLGYDVVQHELGAQVDGVFQGTAAAAAGVRCGDLITSFDGKSIHTDTDVIGATRALAPGDTVHFSVQRLDSNGKTTTVALAARLTGVPALDGGAADPKRAFLGVQTETRITYSFPFPVSIQVGAIGGPSAGLALTLGLLNALGGGDLTGGLKVAATGTIDPQGNVGDVGGVAQKAVAVRDAGAKVFLVPVQEYGAAKSEAGSMKVLPVSTLSQALSDLAKLGGHIPAPTTGAGAA